MFFLENYESGKCYEVLEEEFNQMFGVSSLNDKNDCNVISMFSLNAINANDYCTSHIKISEEKVPYKHINFCGEHRPCERVQFMDDQFCKKHRHDKTK